MAVWRVMGLLPPLLLFMVFIIDDLRSDWLLELVVLFSGGVRPEGQGW